MKFLRTVSPTAWIGLFIISLNIILFLAGPHIAPFGQEEIVGSPFDPPSAAHWFGLDQNGRDMLSRILAGAQMSIGVSLAASLLSFTIGITLGFIAAIFGGWLDTILSRIVDTVMCIPVLISALVVLQALGSSIPVLIVTIALLDSTRVFRLARIVAQGINVLEYAETARLRGEGLLWLVFKEILPNALPGLSNLWLSVTKDSALVAVVGYQELALATRLAGASTKHYFLFFMAAALIYLAITLVSNFLFRLLERRVRRGQPALA